MIQAKPQLLKKYPQTLCAVLDAAYEACGFYYYEQIKQQIVKMKCRCV